MTNNNRHCRSSSGCHITVGDVAPGGDLFIYGMVTSFLSGDVALSSSLCDVGACCGCWVGHVMVGGSGGHW